MVSKVARGTTAGNLLVEALGINTDDRKNFVPVDWVSAVMTTFTAGRSSTARPIT